MTSLVLDLDQLLSSQGFIIQGDAAGDLAGKSVESAGDINGDGFADLIVGAPWGDNGGVSAGEAYVIFGKAGATRANIDLTSLAASDGFIIQGDAAGNQAGFSVSSAGDINRDGFADLIVGAPYGAYGTSRPGDAYVIFGKAGSTRANIDLTTLAASDGFNIRGDAPYDAAGFSVSSAGDINGDGFADLIVGAFGGDNGGGEAGEAYVIFGKAGSSRANIVLTTLAARDGFIIQGDVASDFAGWSVSSAGDINDDGFADLIVGAPNGDNGGSNAGEAYVIFGKAGATRTNIDLTTLAASDGFIIQGDVAGDKAGNSVSAAGDINGDGIADLIVGAPFGDNGGNNAGEAYVIFGKAGATRANIDLTTLSASDGFTIQGDLANDRAGWSVSSAGDINGDGFADLIVGAPTDRNGLGYGYGGTGFNYTGNAYVIFGKAGGTRADIDLASLAVSDGLIIKGDFSYDQAGSSVSSAGDINGDGFADLIVGAPFGDNGGNYAGEAYVIYGNADFGSELAAVDDSLRAIQDQTATYAAFQLLRNDTSGFPLTVSGVSNAVGGTVVLNADQTISFIPTAGFTGTAGFDYTATDGTLSDTGHVTITVRAPVSASTIDLTNLTAAHGFIIQGDAAGDQAGTSVSSAGDINGDGFADLIVGAPQGDNGGRNAGEAYVIFGKAGTTRTDIDLTSLAPSDGFIIQGDVVRDYAGKSVSSAGDINGDGLADLIIGAPYGANGGTYAGEAYVIFGKAGATRANIDLTTLAASDGFIIQGDSSPDQAGTSVSSAGDINGDGIADLIVGAPVGSNGGAYAGEAYVIFGKAGATRTNIDLTTLAASDGFIIQGDVADDNAGWSVASAGDINGDGLADLIVGARGGDNDGTSAGEAYVIFGKTGGTRANIDLTTLAASDGFSIQGNVADDRAGWSVSSAGDINGDGFADVIVGAPNGEKGGVNAGEAYVIFGKAGATRADIDLTNLTASDGFVIVGDDMVDYAGKSVSSAGDVNGDGFADLLVGAPLSDIAGDYAGLAYVIFGKAGATRADIDLTNLTASDGFIIQGDAAGDLAGASVSSAGDINSDGFADLIVGAPLGDNGGSFAGEAYVIYGNADFSSELAAVDDSFRALQDQTATYAALQLLNNDTSGFSLTVSGVSNAVGGTVVLNADQTISFIPTAGFTGTAGFDYIATDGTHSDTGRVTISVEAPAETIDLTGLPANQGFIIQGDTEDDFAGYSVSFAGDINRDGFDDVIVGATGGDNGGSYAGEAYIIFGKAGTTRASIDLTSLTASDGFIIQGDARGDFTGWSVSSAGDINGDGFADMIVGAPSSQRNGSPYGEAYVIFGKAGATRADIDLTSLAASDGFRIEGVYGSNLGWSVSSAGDINGDGFADMILGAPGGDNGGVLAGEAYVIFGKAGATRADIDLTTLTPSDGFIIQGDAPRDTAGISVSSAGDINGDGLADMIVGAPYAGSGSTGVAYVIFGKAGATRTNIDLTSFRASDGFIIQGDAVGDTAGRSVSSAGDVNGDGIADLIVGAPRSDTAGYDTGGAYIIFGKTGATRAKIDLTNLTANDGFIIQGDVAGDFTGRSVSSAGDINGDGFADVIVGAANGDNGGTSAGEAYVIFGKAGGTRADIDFTSLAASDGFIIQGDAAGDQAGFSVSSAGDINGDGFADLIVGARYGDSGGYNAGEAYVIYGSATIGRPNQAPTAAPVTLTAIAEDSGARTITAAELLAGAADADGNTLTITAFSLTSGNGALVDNGDGTWSYTPSAGDDTAATFDYTVSDGSLTASSTASLDITPVNDSPVISSNGGLTTAAVNVAEDTTAVTTVTSNDVDATASPVYAIAGGADADKFAIDAATGALSFIAAPDFENPTDAGRNNVYEVIVSASDGTLAGTQTIAVTVTDATDTFTGTDGTDTLTGTDGADIIFGLGGNDVLDGLRGDDLLNGGIGLDTVSYANATGPVSVSLLVTAAQNTGGAGSDTLLLIENLIGSAFDDRLVGNTGNNRISGGDGNDSLFGGAGADTLIGGEGNDRLDGGTGADTMIGGNGNDSYFVDNAGDTVDETGTDGTERVYATVSFTLGTNVENLSLAGTANLDGTGNALANSLIGNAGNNRLSGGEGNDSLNGGAGADTLIGGNGNDSYFVDNAGDTVDESGTDGTERVYATVSFTLGTNVENLSLAGSTNIDGTGNALANSLIGNAGNNRLSGGEGNDSLTGGAGADTLIGGNGNDSYYVDNAGDTVDESGTDGTERVYATVSFTLGTNVENLSLAGSTNIDGTGNALANSLIGNAGNNRLSGGEGNDSLTGGAGADTLIGGNGNDSYFVDNAGDTVDESGTDGTERVYATVSFTLGTNVENLSLAGSTNIDGTGNALANSLIGNSGANRLSGGEGNDRLEGGEGADTLIGGSGIDTLIGGNGVDRFQFGSALAANADRVVDFAVGADKLVFTALDYGLGAGALLAANFTAGSVAVGGAAQFLYNSAARTLSWDADGGGAGSAVLIATFDTAIALTDADFVLI